MYIADRKNYRTSILYTKWQPGPIKKHKSCFKKLFFFEYLPEMKFQLKGFPS